MKQCHSVLIAGKRTYARRLADALHRTSGILSVVGLTDSAEQAAVLAEQLSPGLIVLQSSLLSPTENPIELLRAQCPVLVVLESSGAQLTVTSLRGAAATVFQSSGEDAVSERVVRFLEERENLTEQTVPGKVTDILREMGIPPHIKGYRYLREAILLAVEDEMVLTSITKLLYPGVAHRFDTTSARVERDIRRAICLAWERGDAVSRRRYFSNTVSNLKGKPTNSEFIAMIADRIQLEEALRSEKKKKQFH